MKKLFVNIPPVPKKKRGRKPKEVIKVDYNHVWVDDLQNTAKKFDQGKLRFDLIPPEVLEALAMVYTYGANKYGDNNWQSLPDFNIRYDAALMRHHNERRKGELYDKESKLLHTAHMLCNSAFLVWKDMQELSANEKDNG